MTVRTSPFTYDGRQLELRAVPQGQEYVVRVWENGATASHVSYTVSFITAFDAGDIDLVGNLMELAARDFIAWSEWQKREAAKSKGSN
jgi:hypothetical protein